MKHPIRGKGSGVDRGLIRLDGHHELRIDDHRIQGRLSRGLMDLILLPTQKVIEHRR